METVEVEASDVRTMKAVERAICAPTPESVLRPSVHCQPAQYPPVVPLKDYRHFAPVTQTGSLPVRTWFNFPQKKLTAIGTMRSTKKAPKALEAGSDGI